ncbi:MAG: 1,4-alpha-glucan branching protein GlgB [Acidimicrobiales bacterium]
MALAEWDALAQCRHSDPHRVLGIHGSVVRTWRRGADSVVLVTSGQSVPMERIHPAGVFEATLAALDDGPVSPEHRFEVSGPGGTYVDDDPYRFWPTLGDLDLHLLGEGRHLRLWDRLGARVIDHQGTGGTAFSVWAPSAQAVAVMGDWNGWDSRAQPMRVLGSSGVWELFCPGVGEGAGYKFAVTGADGVTRDKADPLARATEAPPATASVVTSARHRWDDAEWMRRRAEGDPMSAPMSIYECHLGSWRRVPEEGDRPLTYAEMAAVLPGYLSDLGFTHVEFLPPTEHPFAGSWGYQVSGWFSPSARFGSPDEFRGLVEALHHAGIGVIVDWVPAHFPRDEFALARFDGTALYEHADPRQGEHPDWGTLVFNLGRREVANFLLASALFWLEEFHVDGLRVDAVASMLYLDYSRPEGAWVPNHLGGRENLEAVDFLRAFNETVHLAHPGVVVAAEESTAWPGVSRPTYLGGLGFGFKWNMGWMHDTLSYFGRDPAHRRHHHHDLTFGLLYAFSENFILPLSHDEVVHGKGSLLRRMPGDREHQLAGLRALLAWMWAHPGKKLVFMGAELGQDREWSHDHSLDWHLLADPSHRGVKDLVAHLNHAYQDTPALWEVDFEPDGFRWLEADGADTNTASFVRFDRAGRALVCAANFSGLDRPAHRVGVPCPGCWQVVTDTSDARFGGWRPQPLGAVEADSLAWQCQPYSVAVDLFPLSVVWLVLSSG